MKRSMLKNPAKLWGIHTYFRAKDRYVPKMGPRNHEVIFVESQHYVIDPTNPRRALDNWVENRLHVRRRAADDAEYFGSRRLVLQRLAQFGVALLEFFEQPHILDREERLICECFQEGDLFV